MKQQINLAFIGCGGIAREHLRVLKKLPDVRITACWNRPEDRHLAEEFSREASADYIATDTRQIAEDDSIDAVYICTMHNDRLRHLECFAKAGKAVFMEKPLALSPEEFRAMAQLLKKHPVLFQSGYKTAFNTLMQKMHSLLPKPATAFAHVFDSRWPTNYGAAKNGIGNGNIWSQGVYGADVLYYLMNEIPCSVSAIAELLQESGCAFGTLSASYHFPGGAVGTLLISDEGLAEQNISKFFVEAAGNGNYCCLRQRFTRLSARLSENAEELNLSAEEDGFFRQSEKFIATLRSGAKTTDRTFVDGVVPSLMIHKALEAVRTGRKVNVRIDDWLNENKIRNILPKETVASGL